MASRNFRRRLDASPRGPCRIHVTFASDRTELLTVALRRPETELEDQGGCWSSPMLEGGMAGRSVELAIEWAGEPPQIAAVIALPEVPGDPGAAGADAALAALEVLERDRCLAMLRARARRRFPRDRAEATRFLLRFDAWTNGSVLRHLLDPKFARQLAGAERELFSLGRNTKGVPTPAEVNELAGWLMQCARDRAERLANRDPSDPLNGEDVEARRRRQRMERLLDKVAVFLHATYWTGWPDRDGRVAIADLERAFAQFASGALAFVPAKEPDAYRSKLNAEPDSAYFFLFAEFALRACQRSGAGAVEDWFQLARLFVALQDVFVARYGSPLMKRDLDDQYLREHRSRGRPPSLRDVLEHVERQKAMFPASADLEWLARAHEINLLHAGRDEVIGKLQRGAAGGAPPSPPRSPRRKKESTDRSEGS